MTRTESSASWRTRSRPVDMAIGHLTADIYPEMNDFARELNERQPDAPLVLRDHAQVTRFFDGLELVEPGMVQLFRWVAWPANLLKTISLNGGGVSPRAPSAPPAQYVTQVTPPLRK